MKLHTHIHHDAPCPLPSIITDLDLFSCLAEQCLPVCEFSSIFQTKACRLMKLHYTHLPWCTQPTSIDLYWPWSTFHAWLNKVKSMHLVSSLEHCGILMKLHTNMNHTAHCHWLLLTLTYFSRLAKECLVSVLASFVKEGGLYANETSYLHSPWCIVPITNNHN